MEAMVARLVEPYTRARIKQKLVEVGFTNFGRLRSCDDIRIANSTTAPAGKKIETLAREREHDPLDVACDIIIAVAQLAAEPSPRALELTPLNRTRNGLGKDVLPG
jgi:hypothetical protein